jgi:FKBP-type peptidyl-prolyl cis-trans isomerase FkpA
MRVLASLLSALALTFVLMGQVPSTKAGAATKKAVTAKKTAAGTATKKALPTAAKSTMTFANDDEKLLYTIGMYFNDVNSKQLKSLELNPAELALVQRGLTDAMNGKPALVLEEWGPKINEFAGARQEKTAAKSIGPEKAAGAEYLAKAAAVAGAVKLESGVVYQELTAGTGPSPVAADTVKVHYKGTLINGTEFDSSYKRNEPAEFPLQGVIPCWTEGVQKMKVGGKGKLVCPSDKAYGDRGQPPTIPGGATLVFEIELLEIVKAGGPPTN